MCPKRKVVMSYSAVNISNYMTSPVAITIPACISYRTILYASNMLRCHLFSWGAREMDLMLLSAAVLLVNKILYLLGNDEI
jgi:hypothetical protein